MNARALPEIIAAVDLGSNSFHMVVARQSGGHLTFIDRLKEMVQIARGLDKKGVLDKAAEKRALACLERFGQRLQDMQAGAIRVVGTDTFRRVRKDNKFVKHAQKALGHPIEVISGVEEARLVYLGVAHSIPPNDDARLVVDIGGGSTELIIGKGYDAKKLESLYMGCVSYSDRFFPDGRLSRRRFNKARDAVRLEMRPVKKRFRDAYREAVGASGTIRAVQTALESKGGAPGKISIAGLNGLIDDMIESGRVAKLNIPGVDAARKPVFAGGVAILAEVMKTLRVEEMGISDGALREGLLYDLFGRFHQEDARERTVRALEKRMGVDRHQAERVATTAGVLHKQVAAQLGLESEFAGLILRWAARLHEIGLTVAHSHHDRHAAYLLKHADLAGFPKNEQALLAVLVGTQRRDIQLPFEDLADSWQEKALWLIVLLRISILLHRARSDSQLPDIIASVVKNRINLDFPKSWLKSQPLTLADLRREKGYLHEAGLTLRVNADV